MRSSVRPADLSCRLRAGTSVAWNSCQSFRTAEKSFSVASMAASCAAVGAASARSISPYSPAIAPALRPSVGEAEAAAPKPTGPPAPPELSDDDLTDAHIARDDDS